MSRTKKAPPTGTKAWVEFQVAEAKRIDSEIDAGYIELGRILWDLYDEPQADNPTGKPAFHLLGYDNFDKFLSEVVDMGPRKAQSLRRIYYRLYIELKDLDESLRERVVRLGWTKARSLVRVLTLTNAASWLDFAEKATAVAIETKVTQQIDIAKEKAAAEKEIGFASAAAGAAFDEDEATPAAPKAKKRAKVEIPDATAEEEPPATAVPGEAADLLPTSDQTQAEDVDTGPVFDPAIADINPRSKVFFWLLPEEKKALDDALALSRELSGKNNAGENLALLSLDFVATNNRKPRGSARHEYQVRFLAAAEALLGVHVVATDPKTGNPLYASAALKAAAMEESE